eukprot:360100-Prymnesium_polylepis.1
MDQGFALDPQPSGAALLRAAVNTTTAPAAADGRPTLCLSAPHAAGANVTLSTCASHGERGYEEQLWQWDRPAEWEGDGTQIVWDGSTRDGGNGARLCLSSVFTPTEMNEVLVAPLTNGSWAVALFNRASLPRSLSLEVARLGTSSYRVYDVWAKRALGIAPTVLRRLVGKHDAVLLRLDVDH